MENSLEYSTIEELSGLLSSSKLSTKELILHLLKRSKKLDPLLNVWVTINPDLASKNYVHKIKTYAHDREIVIFHGDVCH